MKIHKKKIGTALTAALLGTMLGGTLFSGLCGAAPVNAYAAAASGPGADSVASGAPSVTASKNIRVLLMNTGFQSIFHPSVTLRANAPVVMTYGGSQQTLGVGEEITIQMDDARLNGGTIIFKTLSAGAAEIAVPSINRSMGTPSYTGTLEVKREAAGLTLINELDLERYLLKVVPSEMPAHYEMEALKAQAICARTYSFNRMQTNVYAEYGAHVDDSVEFQVYNNVNTDARANIAVMETAGKLLSYNGVPVEGYFFSTSCGYTTDSRIWKNPGNTITGYLKGIPVMEGAPPLDLTSNTLFSVFIKDKSRVSYDSFAPFYRWETTVTAAELGAKAPELGGILNAEITERGVGGVAMAMKLSGTAGEKIIKGESEIRKFLGSPNHQIQRLDHSVITGWSMLPSAYIAIDKETAAESGGAENESRFHIYGGGYGHGVGMSQNGAQGMAKAGKNHEEILKFFFTGTQVKSF